MARDVEVRLGDFALTHGDVLEEDCVQGRLYGNENAPLILIPGGISASRFVADDPETGPGVGHNWWAELVYAGGPIDLNRYQVLGVDLAPSGTRNVKKRVTLTTLDQARRLKTLLEYLGVSQVEGAIGTSYGGMVLLAFAQEYTAQLNKLCLLGATHRPFQMGVAWRGIQRRIIDLATGLGAPEEGLKLARQLAMTTYRSPEEFSGRFDVQPQHGDTIGFDVGDYLITCGEKYPAVMPVERFRALSESIDLHRVDPAKITTPTLLVATDTDRLAPPCEKQVLHESLAGPSQLVTISSVFGHDSFLKETGKLAPILSEFCEGKRRAA